MPLDPQIDAMLTEFRKARGKPIEQMTPREARFAGWAWKYLMGEPEEIANVAYHFIPGPTADLPARIYRPAGAGDSAGANLAAAVTLKARDENGPKLAWQMLAYPCLRVAWDSASATEHGTGYTLERAGIEYFWNHYIRGPEDAGDPLCAPLQARSHAGLPPALIVCAQYDPLLDDGRDYAAKLEAANVPVQLRICAGMSHGFLWMGGRVDRAREAVDEIAAAASEALG